MVVAQDPSALEARQALMATTQLLDERREDGDEDNDSDLDLSTETEQDDMASEATLVLSDSSDYEHNGNGVPCKFYNHNGCAKGSMCGFKHAPDHRSLRDKLCVAPFWRNSVTETLACG